MKFAAVIVTFNRLGKLKETVARTLCEPFSYVIVVNNASADGTAAWLDALDEERLIVKYLPKNLGGAGGFHYGFKTAVDETDAEWLVCFDDDAYPERGVLAAFEALSLPDDVASVASAVYLPNGAISEMNRPRYNPFWHFRRFLKTAIKGKSGFYVPDGAYSSGTLSEIDASTFVGYFVRADLVKTSMGLPRCELFIYADDLIYTMQAHKLGYRHLFCSKLKFVHDCDTLVNQQDIYRPVWKVYYTYRNRIEMYRVGFGLFFHPILWLQLPKWRAQAKYYENPALFLRLFELALSDAMKRDFSRSHEELLAFIEGVEHAG